MKVKLSDLATTPLLQGTGVVLSGVVNGVAQRYLPGIGALAATVAVGYVGTQQGQTVRRIGQGVLAGVAAGILGPFLLRLVPDGLMFVGPMPKGGA